MKFVDFDVYFEDRKYRVWVNAEDGEMVKYAVHFVGHKGKRVVRKLWDNFDGKPLPELGKKIRNMQGFSDRIAEAIGW